MGGCTAEGNASKEGHPVALRRQGQATRQQRRTRALHHLAALHHSSSQPSSIIWARSTPVSTPLAAASPHLLGLRQERGLLPRVEARLLLAPPLQQLRHAPAVLAGQLGQEVEGIPAAERCVVSRCGVRGGNPWDSTHMRQLSLLSLRAPKVYSSRGCPMACTTAPSAASRRTWTGSPHSRA